MNEPTAAQVVANVRRVQSLSPIARDDLLFALVAYALVQVPDRLEEYMVAAERLDAGL